MKKKDIVKNARDFNSIIKNESKVANNGFVIYYRKNNQEINRYGISVGTKLGNAVFRNKFKRKIRMIVTTHMNKMVNRGVDYIILLRKSGIELSYHQLEEKYLDLMKKLKEIK